MGGLRIRKADVHFRIIEKKIGRAVFRKRIYELLGDRSDYRVLGEAKALTFRGCLLIAADNVDNFFGRVVAYRLNKASGRFKTDVSFYEKRKH